MPRADVSWKSLPPAAQLAVLARALAREGYTDLTGRISYRQEDGTLLVTPQRLFWEEAHAGAMVHVDAHGAPLGAGSITARIPLHLEFHKRRADARVIVHNHPPWATTWAAAHQVPPVHDHVSARFARPPVVYDDSHWSGDAMVDALACIASVGDAQTLLLANHGVLVVAESIEQAYQLASSLEWRARLAAQVKSLGGGPELDETLRQTIARLYPDFLYPALFDAVCRREIATDPEVLS